MSLKNYRTQDGKRLRSPEEFIRSQGADPISRVVIFNKRDKVVIEAWKNMRTKHTHVVKIRRPTGEEEKQFTSMIVREQLLNEKQNQDQVEIIVGGDDYVKQAMKSK